MKPSSVVVVVCAIVLLITITYIICLMIVGPLLPSQPVFSVGSPVPCNNYVAMVSNHSYYGDDYRLHTSYMGSDNISYVLNDDTTVIDLNRTLRKSVGVCIGAHCALRNFKYENVSPDPSVDNLCRVVP